MKDSMKPCQHTLSDDIVYKEVVVIGNGPSGMVTSFMLAGNVPHLKDVPDDLPIDEMLRARLTNLPKGQSLYDVDLMELAEGLEGRSQNPIPLLMDNLLRPCADLGIQADSLIEWKYDIEKEIDHIVLGRGPPGGAWHTFPRSVRTLSPGAWLCLPPHASSNTKRLSARAVASYCRRYVTELRLQVFREEAWLCLPPHASSNTKRLSARAVASYCRRYVTELRLQKYFRCGVTVSSVTRVPRSPCERAACPLRAAFCVAGYDQTQGRAFRYLCSRVVIATGGGDRPNTLPPAQEHALHSLEAIERAIHVLATSVPALPSPPSVLVVGSGVSAADAVRLARRGRLRTLHLHRTPADALARLPPRDYPDYCQVYKMMCDGSSGNYPNYKSFPKHIIVDVTPLHDVVHPVLTTDENEDALRPKRVRLLDLVTNETTDVTVNLIAVLIGSKPDLFFLQTNFSLDCIDVKRCTKCDENNAPMKKIKIDDSERQCSLKHHWTYLKNVLGQSIQSCKSRYLNYTEINGNTNTKCIVPDCNKRETEKCSCLISELENGRIKTSLNDCKCDVIPYPDIETKCTCEENPYSSGIGFGVDPKKPVDGRSNPISIDKSSHELLNAPKGMYALGPLTADNFVRFIPGGALAIVSSIHKESKV